MRYELLLHDMDHAPELEVVRALPPQAVVLDVGAAIGDVSRLVLNEVESPQIHAFEPNPNNLRDLADLPINIVPFAVGASRQTVRLYSAVSSDRGDLLGSLRERQVVGCMSTYEVAMITLDQYCAMHGVSHVDLLKIDVEGHELGVLRGAETLLREHRCDKILFEHLDGWDFVDGYKPSYAEIEKFLLDLGYVTRCLGEGQFLSEPQ